MSASERGAVAVSALLMWLSVATAGLLVVATVSDLAVAGVRAQAAADAAALAAAGATFLGPAPAAPADAAGIAARLHGAKLVRCCGEVTVLPPRVRVTVAVTPSSSLGRLVRSAVRRDAAASLRPAKDLALRSGLAAVVPNS